MVKKITSFFVIGLFALNFIVAQVDDAVVLTIDEAVEYAKNNSRTLQSDSIDLAIKERAAKYSWNVFLPNVNASISGVRTTDVGSSLQMQNVLANTLSGLDNAFGGALSSSGMKIPVPASVTEGKHWAIAGNISAGLNLSLAYIYSIKAAKASYEGGVITKDQSEKQTILNIKKLFYGLLLQQESLKIQKDSLESARQRASQAEVNFRNGRVPQIQLLNAQVAYENKKPEVAAAEQGFNQQLDMFAFLLGMPVGTKIQLNGSIEPEYVNVTSDGLLQNCGQNSLNIRSLQNNIDVMKMNLKMLNLSCYTPALAVNYGWQPTYSMGSWVDRGSLSFTLAWNLTNLLPWSSNRQQAQELKDNIKKLELALVTLQENQKAQVRKAVDTLNQAREQIDSMGRTVELAQTSYNMSQTAYNNGRMELLDLRDAESQLNQARLGQLNQKFNYISAFMDLEYELNTELSEYKE